MSARCRHLTFTRDQATQGRYGGEVAEQKEYGAVKRAWLFVLCSAGWLHTACWNATQWNGEQLQSVQNRAAFDLSCPKEQVSVVEIEHDPDEGVNTIGASGCGKKATYVNAGGRMAPTWAMDSAQNPQ